MNLTAFGLASLIGMTATIPVAAAEPAHPTIRHMAARAGRGLAGCGEDCGVGDRLPERVLRRQRRAGLRRWPHGHSRWRGRTAPAKRVVAFANAHGIRVIHVQHVLPAGAPLFALGSVNADFHRDLQPRKGETVVQKDNVSVFAGSSASVLDTVLKHAGIDTLIVTGLQTHACVAGAARDAAAAPRGYRVIVSSDASASRD